MNNQLLRCSKKSQMMNEGTSYGKFSNPMIHIRVLNGHLKKWLRLKRNRKKKKRKTLYTIMIKQRRLLQRSSIRNNLRKVSLCKLNSNVMRLSMRSMINTVNLGTHNNKMITLNLNMTHTNKKRTISLRRTHNSQKRNINMRMTHNIQKRTINLGMTHRYQKRTFNMRMSHNNHQKRTINL